MIEVGDMFLYIDDEDEAAFDIGWVIHVGNEGYREEGLAKLIHIRWLRHPADGDKAVDCVWQHHLEAYKEFTLIKGGQHAE